MRIVIYARVSKNDETQDVGNQLKPLRDFAKALGGEVTEEYIDRASGSRSDREAFLRMLTDADKHKFDLIIVWALDRLSREGISTFFGYIQRFKRSGVALKSLKESWLDTRDKGISELLLAVFSWVAEQERKRISERVKAGLAKRKGDGKRLGRPYGSKDKRPRRRSGYHQRYASKPR